jgi:hypothetical protein
MGRGQPLRGETIRTSRTGRVVTAVRNDRQPSNSPVERDAVSLRLVAGEARLDST